MIYKFKDWVDTDKIGWHFVSSNPKAIRIIEKNPKKIVWQYLCHNSNAIHILEKNLDKIDWHWLGKNRGAIHLMKKNLDKNFWYSIADNENAMELIEDPRSKFWSTLEWNTNPRAISMLEERIKKGYDLSWTCLAKNPHAIHLIEQNLDKVNECDKSGGSAWRILSRYKHGYHLLEQNLDKVHWSDFNAMNPCVVQMLKKYPEKTNWLQLSQNPYAIPLLEKNLDKVDWSFLCYNVNAVHILEQHPDKINWRGLSTNPNAGYLLEKNLDKKDKFNWDCMGCCDHIYEIDYKYLEDRCNVFKAELIQKVMHPRRFEKYIEAGYDVEDIFEFV